MTAQVQKNQELTARFAQAVAAGDLAVVTDLLERGVDANAIFEGRNVIVDAIDKGQDACAELILKKKGAGALTPGNINIALQWAAFKGNMPLVELAIEAGGDPLYKDSNGKNAQYFASANKHLKVAEFLSPWYKPDEITLFRTISDRVLEEIYDFNAKERITLLRKEKGGAVEHCSRELFQDIPQPQLRAAFEQHRRHGGKRSEMEVFTNMLQKPKLRPLKP